jgi:protein TonB
MASSAIRYSLRRQGDARWRRNLAVGSVVALLHLGVIIALVRGLAGGIAALPLPHSALVLLSAPEPAPSPTASARPIPPPPASHTPAGARGAMGRKARPKAIMAPPPRIVLPALQAAPVAGLGDATLSGAGASGTGNGGSVAGPARAAAPAGTAQAPAWPSA